MFVDETSFSYVHCNIKYFFEIDGKEIKEVFEWCSMNGLSVNTAKTEYIFL